MACSHVHESPQESLNGMVWYVRRLGRLHSRMPASPPHEHTTIPIVVLGTVRQSITGIHTVICAPSTRQVDDLFCLIFVRVGKCCACYSTVHLLLSKSSLEKSLTLHVLQAHCIRLQSIPNECESGEPWTTLLMYRDHTDLVHARPNERSCTCHLSKTTPTLTASFPATATYCIGLGIQCLVATICTMVIDWGTF